MKIISGCQTGADEAGLRAAKDLDISTGGTMPKGWKTQTGPRPDWGREYGLVEHGSPKYPPRTRKNVIDANATILFGDMNSSGCKLTIKYCRENDRPYLTVPYYKNSGNSTEEATHNVLEFLREYKPTIINIAGNRENVNNGVSNYTYIVLIKSLYIYQQEFNDVIDSLFK